jgi:hypothetical protein
MCICHSYIPPTGRTSTVYINFLLISSDKNGYFGYVLQRFTDQIVKKICILTVVPSRSLNGPAHIRYAQQEGMNEIVYGKSNNLFFNIDSFSLNLSFSDFALGYLQTNNLVAINKNFYHRISMKSKL